MNNETLLQDGHAWVRHLLSGEATQRDTRELRRWRALSAAHEQAFQQAARMHGLVRAAVAELRAEQRAAALPARVRPRLYSRRLVLRGALAASAAGVAVLAASRAGFGPLGGAAADFETAKGQTRHVELDRGVAIELNTLTRVARRPDVSPAAFEVLGGEVIVTASRTAQSPAVAIAVGGRTVAAEARFSIRCDAAAVDVSCLMGAVRVESAGAATELAAGQGNLYGSHGLGPVVQVDPAQVESWRSGRLVFRDEALGHVIDEINRYRPGRIVLANPALAERHVNAVFYLNNIDEVLDQMHLAYGAHITHLPGGVVVAV